MKTKYFLLIFASIWLVSCNKTNETSTTEKKLTKKSEKLDETSVLTNELFANIEYQIQAFKIASERISNPELTKYLTTNLTKLKMLSNDYKLAASDNKINLINDGKAHQKELYQLSIADAKDFDKIFVLYYKNFLNKTIDQVSSKEEKNEGLKALKDKYGNILYEQKLYFENLE